MHIILLSTSIQHDWKEIVKMVAPIIAQSTTIQTSYILYYYEPFMTSVKEYFHSSSSIIKSNYIKSSSFTTQKLSCFSTATSLLASSCINHCTTMAVSRNTYLLNTDSLDNGNSETSDNNTLTYNNIRRINHTCSPIWVILLTQHYYST